MYSKFLPIVSKKKGSKNSPEEKLIGN